MTRAGAFISACGGFTMKSSVLLGAAASAAFALAASSAAHADGVVTNADLASPGVYFGSGNPNGAFVVDTESGIEIGLRSKISGVHPQITPVGDVYDIPLGDTFNFDYSFNPDVGGSEASIAGLTQLITVSDAFGFFTSYDPTASSPVGDNAIHAGTPGAFQNSEKISFHFLDGAGYDPNKNDTFHVTYTVSNSAGTPVLAVQNVVNIGAGAVPEPASWALMIFGFGGAGAMLRRRRTSGAVTA